MTNCTLKMSSSILVDAIGRPMGQPAAHLSMCQHLSVSAEERQSVQDSLPEEESK